MQWASTKSTTRLPVHAGRGLVKVYRDRSRRWPTRNRIELRCVQVATPTWQCQMTLRLKSCHFKAICTTYESSAPSSVKRDCRREHAASVAEAAAAFSDSIFAISGRRKDILVIVSGDRHLSAAISCTVKAHHVRANGAEGSIVASVERRVMFREFIHQRLSDTCLRPGNVRTVHR